MIAEYRIMKVHYLFIIITLLYSCSAGKGDGDVKPDVKNITESVYASVTIKPQPSYNVSATRHGVIKEVMVKEGDLIKKGQVLFTVTAPPDVTSGVTNAELSLQEARKNYYGDNNLLDNITLELQTANEQLILDSTNFERQKRLREQNIGSKLEYERAELAYQAAKSRYNVLQKQYAQTLNKLEIGYKKAKNQVFAQRSVLADFVVTSKIDGMVYRIYKEAGELISIQERFAEVGSADSFIIQMDIDEVDIVKINLEDTVAIVLDAYPDQVFRAAISSISPTKDEVTQTFEVESVFIKEPSKLYNGLSGEANIIVGRRANALTIPAEYLLKGNKVLTNDGERTVTIGVKNLKYVEVLSGIDSNTVLKKPDN